jgi:butyryl-CoA dehydrogenase
MLHYTAPLRDIEFLLEEVLDAEKAFSELHKRDPWTLADIREVLVQAERLVTEQILLMNQSADEQGCSLLNGNVHVPRELHQAFKAYVAGGWPSLTCAPEDGGQGLPNVVGLVLQEMLNSTSITFGDYVGLCSFAYRLLKVHGSTDLKARYLARLAAGELAATMCMTEPQCGTDIGLIKTTATPVTERTFRVTGTKIFISGGDHDLTHNILHLVLARIEGAPNGVKGLSLFAVPKWLPSSDGRAEEIRNAVAVASLEHKMGYSASATCQLAFEGALAELIGEPGRGLHAMFTMVNIARIAVAGQGLGGAAVAYQNAARYARSRLQGRAPRGALHPDLPADPLIVHPDVRRLLLTTRAFVEVGRAAFFWLGGLLDVVDYHPDPQRRSEAEQWLALMTPVAKATLTDFGFAACNDCLQIFGGHGYIRSTGMEQLVRDVRLAQIQEGANGMLATHLLHRQVASGNPAYHSFVATCRSLVEAQRDNSGLAEYVTGLAWIIDLLEQASEWLIPRARHAPEEYGAAATEFQHLLGLALFTWLWTRMGIAAQRALESLSASFYRDKLLTGSFFIQRVLPRAAGHFAILRKGAGSLIKPSEDYFRWAIWHM